MERIKLQHYVPRFYLRNFSRSHGKAYVINCFDKSELRKFLVNIKSIGSEKYFYDIDRNTKQIIEKTLTNFESIFNAAYSKLISKEDLNCLNLKEKVAIAHFVAIQEIRTRETREFIRDIAKQAKRKLSKYPLSKKIERQLEEVTTEKSIKSRHLKMLIEEICIKSKFTHMILDKKWVLIENNTDMPFWTSDHPVNRYNPLKVPYPFGNLGLLSRGIQIFFPLNPKLSLCFCDPVEYFIYPEKLTSDIENVKFQNSLQVISSTRHIFSIGDDFSLAVEMISKDASLKNINRKRVTVH